VWKIVTSRNFVRCTITALAGFCFAGSAVAEQPAESGALTVVVSGARTADGVIRIAVCPDDACYQNNGPFIAKRNAPASTEPVTFTFPDLPSGDYAIVMHHDEDDDGEFDRFIVPLEGYGFSNDIEPGFGRPPFYAVAVKLTSDGLTAPITVQY